MLNILKGELVKLGLNPVHAIVEATGCSEKTSRNKLNEETAFTIREALLIEAAYFSEDKDNKFDIRKLFASDTDLKPTG